MPSPTTNDRQRGFALGVVAIVLIALSIAGVAILTLSSGEADLAGQLKRQQQLQACAQAGADIAIAKLPDITAAPYTLEPTYSATPGHFTNGVLPTAPSVGVVPSNLAPDLPVRSSGENLANRVQPASLGGGAAGVTRQPYRFVTTCTSDGKTAEAESIIIYGGGR